MKNEIYQILTKVQNGEQSVGEAQAELLFIFSVSGCYTRIDMIAAYDAGVWNPNDQKAEEWLNQAYNCR